jgi:pyruvate/2-oxoglutarate dehydrogenase complex dihydrolipoamide dehydrogenase (E3) component
MTSASSPGSATDVDVVVVGLGPGGEAAATKLAAAGLSVVAVDKHLVGGECPYYGCIPTKMMIRAADALAEARRVPELAGDSTTVADWAPVARRIRDEATDDWDDKVAVERLEQAGATVVHGAARITGPRTVEVGGRSYRASRGVVVNTGTAPSAPPVEGLADTPYWTNRDVVQMASLPASMAVIGGGAIGCEVAQAVARFGVRVTILEVADRILAPEEPEASELLTTVLSGEGVRVVTGAKIQRVDHADGRFTVTLDGETVEADKLLVAAGRRPNLADLGLETVGLDPTARSLDTDGRMRVLRDGEPVDGLWAVGDVTGKGAFTHTSMYHSGIVVRELLGRDGPEADHRALPRVTFTDPEVGSVGTTEAKAREQGLDVRTGTAQLPSSSRGFIHAAGNDGFIKLVAEGDQLVGATSVGPTGGEVLSMLTTAIHGRVPVSTLRSMIYAYPTFHRAVLDALEALG